MATESIQHGVATPPGSGYEAEVPAAGLAAAADIAEAGILNDVHYVKDVLATRKGGLSDAELNALSHLITQLSTAFGIEQAFAANITSFEQLEKALSALEELLEQVEKAKAEIKEGLKTIILTESLSAALGGLVAAKSFSTAISQYRYNAFFNKAQSNLRGRGTGNTDITPAQNNQYRAAGNDANAVVSEPGIGNPTPQRAAPRPSANRETEPPQRQPENGPQPPERSAAAGATTATRRSSEGRTDANRGQNAENRDAETAQAEPNSRSQAPAEPNAGAANGGQNAGNRDAEAARRGEQDGSGNAASSGRSDVPEDRLLRQLDEQDGPGWNPLKGGYANTIPLKDLPSGEQLRGMESEAVSRLGSYASTNAQKLGYRAEFEMMGARLVQQFAKSFSSLGETQQSIANIDVNADTNVYSNQSEYWSVLMGTYQRLAQEYQTVFQHDLGALGEDVSQASQMAQYLYRS